MCGIVCAFDIKRNSQELRPQVLQMSKRVRHRGPDWSGIFSNNKAILAHERLSIVDPESGKQPLYSKDGKLVLAVNGEIYNHQEIIKKFDGKYDFLKNSDWDVILAL
jgi:asparagine synthase (glutamine-hydrolysing)